MARNLSTKPAHLEGLMGTNPLLGLSNQSLGKETSKLNCFFFLYLILDLQDHAQGIVGEMGKLFHRAVLLKIFVLFRASSDEVRMEGPCEFLYLCEVILVFTPGLVFPGVKQEVSCKHLVDHTSKGPNISSLVIGLSEDYLWGTILPSLYLSRKMMVLPAGIAQVSYLYSERHLQLLPSLETYLPLLYIEQLLQTVLSLTLLLVLFLSLLQQLLLQSFLLVFTQLTAFKFLLQLTEL